MKTKLLFWLTFLSFQVSFAQIKIEEASNDGSIEGYIVTKSKKPVDGIVYHSAEDISDGFVKVITNKGLTGIYAPTGRILIPVVYDRIEYFNGQGFFIVFKKNEMGETCMGAFNQKGIKILDTKYHGINPESEAVDYDLLEICVRTPEGVRYGYADYTGKIIMPPLYERVALKFIDRKSKYKMNFVTGIRNGKQALYDVAGRKLGSDYASIGEAPLANSGLVPVTCEINADEKRLMGFIDIISGKDSFPCRFDVVEETDNNEAVVGYNGYLGLMKDGRLMIPTHYRFAYIEALQDKGVYYCSTGNDSVMIYLEGENRFLERVFADAECKNDLVIATITKQQGGAEYINQVLYNLKSKAWQKDTFGYYTPWYENSTLEKGGTWWVADKKGKSTLNIPGKWNSCRFVYANCMLVTTPDKKCGLMNAQAKILTEPVYEDIKPIDDFFLQVKKDRLFGIIKPDGQWLLQPEFDEIVPFIIVPVNMSGFYRAKKNGKYGLIGKEGTLILDTQYEEIYAVLTTDRVCAKKNGKYGVVDYKGNVILPFDYSFATSATYEWKNKQLEK